MVEGNGDDSIPGMATKRPCYHGRRSDPRPNPQVRAKSTKSTEPHVHACRLQGRGHDIYRSGVSWRRITAAVWRLLASLGGGVDTLRRLCLFVSFPALFVPGTRQPEGSLVGKRPGCPAARRRRFAPRAEPAGVPGNLEHMGLTEAGPPGYPDDPDSHGHLSAAGYPAAMKAATGFEGNLPTRGRPAAPENGGRDEGHGVFADARMARQKP